MKLIFCFAFWVHSHSPIQVIKNLEYVKVQWIFWIRKEKHVAYLILRNGVYYYPNTAQCHIIAYKQIGQDEVKIKK